jgi:hypothetical protein
MSISVKEIAWLAGLLEGEASFGLTNNKRSPAIWIGMTDVDIIERVRNLIDSSKSVNVKEDNRKEGYKTVYRLTLNGSRAISWMMTIYPLMSVRRKAKIREVLSTWKIVNLEVKYDTKSFKDKTHSPLARTFIGLTRRLHGLGFSDLDIEIAKIFKTRGFTDKQIFEKLGELEKIVIQ